MKKIALTLLVVACSSSSEPVVAIPDETTEDAIEVTGDVLDAGPEAAFQEVMFETGDKSELEPETAAADEAQEILTEAQDLSTDGQEVSGDVEAEAVAPYYENCIELFACVQACADNVCKAACLNSASQQAVDDLMALKQCIDQQCPECDDPPDWKKQQCEDCRKAAVSGPACQVQFLKCYPQQGTKKCGEILACVFQCKDDQCRGACVAEGDGEAKLLLEALRVCAFTACPDAPDPNDPCILATLSGECKAEYEACQNDS